MIELFRTPNYDFIGKRKWTYVLSGLITLVSLLSLATQGLRYDIDFTGGTLVQVRFERVPQVQQLRGALGKIGFGDSIIQEYGSASEYIVRVPLTGATFEASQELKRRVEGALARPTAGPRPHR